MNESTSDSVRRFTTLSEVYARCRPDYPAECIDFVVAHCGLGPSSLLIDVGAGTGISARLFAQRGIPVVGIEPNEAMRRRAEAEPGPAHLVYRAGTGEQTGLPADVADLVLSAQAFHWFDAPAALAEFARILHVGGHVALLWNERDESDPCTAAYGAVVRSLPGAAGIEGSRFGSGVALLESPLFVDGQKLTYAHEQSVDEEGLLGRAFSISYAPREPTEAERFAADLRRVFARFQQGGRIVLRYETTLYLARRPC
jgi:SAM-dependent methyltransferase